MKAAEARALPSEELRHQLDELQEEQFNLRFQNATGQLENYKRLGIVDGDIARIATILRERELGIEIEPAAERPKRRRKRKEDEAAEVSDVEADADEDGEIE